MLLVSLFGFLVSDPFQSVCFWGFLVLLHVFTRCNSFRVALPFPHGFSLACTAGASSNAVSLATSPLFKWRLPSHKPLRLPFPNKSHVNEPQTPRFKPAPCFFPVVSCWVAEKNQRSSSMLCISSNRSCCRLVDRLEKKPIQASSILIG